jgi:hypothetical protein
MWCAVEHGSLEKKQRASRPPHTKGNPRQQYTNVKSVLFGKIALHREIEVDIFCLSYSLSCRLLIDRTAKKAEKRGRESPLFFLLHRCRPSNCKAKSIAYKLAPQARDCCVVACFAEDCGKRRDSSRLVALEPIGKHC